ncbi:MAG: aldehyde dehydrogenase family protein [Acidiphilium sp.]
MLDKPAIRLAPPTEPRRFRMLINGAWVNAGDGAVTVRSSPAHDVPVSIVPKGSSVDADRAVAAARCAFDDGRWSGLSGSTRAAVLLEAGRRIRARRDEIALLETLESGKPITQSRGEVDGAADIFDYASGQARSLHGDAFNNLGDGMLGLVTREPIGVVAVITPWNFPFFILSERIPFVLAAGCTVVVKPSDLTSASTLLLGEILQEAGLPDGVYNVVTGPGSIIGSRLVAHNDVDMISFTGSTEVGRNILRASADDMKKVGLELGGKNPQLVFADADLEAAADGVVFGLAFNAGQCCVSGSRLVVDESIADAFAARVVDKIGRLVIGDPLDEATQVGAIVDPKQHEKILGLIEEGRTAGARLLCGGSALATPAGRFIQPTVFSDVTRDMSIVREEIFGPVLSVLPFRTFDEALRIANDTCFGLAGSIWTRDINKALRAMRGLKAGRVWINCTITGGPELPIGGFKQSGIGRETGSYGVEEYTEIKSTHIELGERTRWVAN